MADSNQGWFETVRDAFYDALCAVFQVDPTAQSSLDRFIPAYVDGVMTPQEDRNVDVCYYAISEEQGTDFDYVMQEDKEDKVVVKKTIPVNILTTFYGPHADSDAEKFWSRLQVDTGYGSARSILRGKKITLRGKPRRPVTMPPEIEGSIWRRRCDVQVSLSYLDTETLATRTVTKVPEINIKAE